MGALLSRLVFLGLSICTLNGCATLVFGRYDKVDIITEPNGVEIYDSQGFTSELLLSRFHSSDSRAST